MTTAYPDGIDNFTNPTSTDPLNSSTVRHSLQHANVNDAVEAIENELGTDPKGSAASVKDRLVALDATVASKETPAGAQAKADAAQSAAIATASSDATTKANAAQSSAQAYTDGKSIIATAPITKSGTLGTGLTIGIDQTGLTITESQVTNLVTDLAAKAPTSRTISTTAPIAGGGDLSANRTLSLNIGSSLTTSSSNLIVDSTVIPYLANANTFTASPQQITVNAAGNKGLIVKGAASQTANLQEWQNSGAGILAQVDAFGSASFGGNNTFGSSLGVGSAGSATQPAITVRSAANYTADFQRFQTSAATVLGGVNALAQTYTGSTSPILAATGGATTAASGTGTTATITTTSAHGLAVGDLVTVAGVTPTGYNGTFLVTAVGTNTISYLNATTGAQTVAGTVSAPAQSSVTARSAGTRGLVVRGAASQSANLIEWQDSAGTVLSRVRSDGVIYGTQVVAGSSNLGSQLSVASPTAAAICIIVKGAASQTADLQQWQNSAGTVLTSILATGTINFASGNTSATATAGAITAPTLVAGYITMQIAGTTVKVPYYSN